MHPDPYRNKTLCDVLVKEPDINSSFTTTNKTDSKVQRDSRYSECETCPNPTDFEFAMRSQAADRVVVVGVGHFRRPRAALRDLDINTGISIRSGVI